MARKPVDWRYPGVPEKRRGLLDRWLGRRPPEDNAKERPSERLRARYGVLRTKSLLPIGGGRKPLPPADEDEPQEPMSRKDLVALIAASVPPRPAPPKPPPQQKNARPEPVPARPAQVDAPVRLATLAPFSRDVPAVRAEPRTPRPQPKPEPKPVHASKPLFRSSTEAYSRGDKILFASGITLSLVCAFFPWYVFLNQDQFGIRAVQLGDVPSSGPIPDDAIPAGRIEAPIPVQALAKGQEELDTFATGTLQDVDEEKKPHEREDDQPFPLPDVAFRLVHVANGRAMIEDDSGLFVVQRGSTLPDSSRVTAIERRGSRWVVVTSNGRVLEVGS